MGDEERETLTTQHADILTKLDTMATKVTRAEGAFWATGILGLGLIALIGIIYSGMTETLKSTTRQTSINTKDIAVIREKYTDYDRRFEEIDSKLERVRYKK